MFWAWFVRLPLMSLKLTQRWLGYLLLVAVFLFAAYSNVRLGVRNYQINQTIEFTRQEVSDLSARNEKLKLLLTFYQTPEYQEVEAKRRLGLKRPDETAVLVNGIPANSLASALEDFVYREPTPEAPPQETNLQKWWKYLLGQSRNG